MYAIAMAAEVIYFIFWASRQTAVATTGVCNIGRPKPGLTILRNLASFELLYKIFKKPCAA